MFSPGVPLKDHLAKLEQLPIELIQNDLVNRAKSLLGAEPNYGNLREYREHLRTVTEQFLSNIYTPITASTSLNKSFLGF